jgi:hypothetical protein
MRFIHLIHLILSIILCSNGLLSVFSHKAAVLPADAVSATEAASLKDDINNVIRVEFIGRIPRGTVIVEGVFLATSLSS